MVFQSLTSSQVACCSSKTDTWKGLFKRSAIRDYIQIVGGFKYGVSGCILRETAAVTYGPKEAGDHIVSLNLFFQERPTSGGRFYSRIALNVVGAQTSHLENSPKKAFHDALLVESISPRLRLA